MNIILFEENENTDSLSLEDRRARHILEILRLAVGDSFDMGIIGGPRGKGVVEDVLKKTMRLRFIPGKERQVPLAPITLICGAIRPVGMKRILKDMTQLGVERICVTGTEKGEASYLKSRLWTRGEYRQLLKEGAEQAFVTLVPEVMLFPELAATLYECMRDVKETSLDLLALDNYEGKTLLGHAKLSGGKCVVAVGPERGWSSRERDIFKHSGYSICSMGKRVLKTETAATAAVSLLLSKIGEL